MAWQFSLNTRATLYHWTKWSRQALQDYGPHVNRRWVKSRADKRHRVKASSLTNTTALGPRTSDRGMEHKAVEYARWLAARDAILLGGELLLPLLVTLHDLGHLDRADQLAGLVKKPSR